MARISSSFPFILAAGLAATACAADPEADTAEAESDAAENAEAEALDAAAPETGETAEAETASEDWAALDDPMTRSAIDARLNAAAGEIGQFGFLVVDSLDGADHFGAAGEAAFDLGIPAIVVSTGQREVHIVGDEALAYEADFRTGVEADLAAAFDRGDYAGGIEDALDAIAQHFAEGG